MKAQNVPDTRDRVPGIHLFLGDAKTWMAGTSPAMTRRMTMFRNFSAYGSSSVSQ